MIRALSRCKRTLPSIGVLFVFLLSGCGGGSDSGSTDRGGEATTAKKTAQAPAVDMATAATISGTVAFSGEAPMMPVIDMAAEATCHDKHGSAPMHEQTVVVNDNNTLRWVFVYVKDGLGGAEFPVPETPVVLDQVGCTYEPHIFGIMAKQPLLIKNSDEGVLHNIHTLSKAGNSFNFGMPRIMESTKEFKKPETMVRIKCDVHGWMNAYAGVLDHPFYAVTGTDGSFKLPPLPPGQYTIEAWHEEYGAQTQSVTVSAKEMKEISFTFSAGS
jgi:hypothetical protein